MRKRLLSLICVLALCLGLLPATALAAGEDAPAKLYVGDQPVIVAETVTYWTTDESGGLTRDYDATDNSADWSVRYNPTNATLTLRDAIIKKTNTSGNNAVIYAQSNSQSAVSLTIQLEGTNTIVCDSAYYGIYVNAEMSGTSYGKDASLTITGNGSLDVSGSSYGIYVKSGSGDASLTIENASVVANTTSQFYSGVVVQSSSFSQNSPALSLAVNGGSLTANGGDNGAGIQFNVVSSDANDATTSLTVKNNAIVKAINGIKVSHVDKPIPSGTGIVFDDKEGTVYGDVTLQEDLEIGEGETLTIPEDSSLDTNDKTVTVESGGKLEGKPTGNGTVKIAPTITTESLNEGMVGTEYSQELKATGDTPITWKLDSGNLPDDLTLDENTGVISGTPTTKDTYKFTVKAENSTGSDSQEYTLEIKPLPVVSVTGVTLNKTELSLFTGESETLTATVEPSTATNRYVTWISDKPEVAAVTDGVVTAKTAGEATITVTTQDGGKQATCKVTVTQSAYSMTADPTALDFGSAYTGDPQPAAQTVTIKNTGNQTLTLTQPVSANSFDVGPLSNTSLPVDGTVTFTVQPKAGLPVGTYTEEIIVSGTGGAAVTIPASFTVEQRSSGGAYHPQAGTTTTSDRYEIDKPSNVENGAVKVSPSKAQKGDMVTITVTPDEGYALDELTVYDEDGDEIDLEDEGDGAYTFEMPKGDVEIEVSFAAIAVEIPPADFSDVASDAWYADAVQYVYENGLMSGTSETTFSPNLTTTRGMIVTTLYRLEGAPDLSNENLGYPYADVDPSAYYTDAVYWARQNGIVSGMSAEQFAPNNAITREQMASILYRYAQFKGYDVSVGENTNILSYTDFAALDAYAIPAMQWACGAGVITGMSEATLSPDGSATRAQVAAILMRFCENIAK